MGDETLECELKHRAGQACTKGKPLERVQARLLARGAGSFNGIGRLFRIVDDDRNQKLNSEEFDDTMSILGIKLKDDEKAEVFKHFDKDGNGLINMEEFAEALKPKLNAGRTKLVQKCFAKMDATGDGVITVEDLAKTYKVHHHPKFKSGEWTQGQVLRKFLDTFDAKNHEDGKVTYKEFESYYASLGACIDNDMYFALMLQNAWGI